MKNCLATMILTMSVLGSSALAAELPGPGGAAPSSRVDVDLLKDDFLACERAATQRRLAAATTGVCSIVYEELRERAFGGSFDALLAWWRGARDGAAEATSAARASDPADQTIAPLPPQSR